MSNITFAFQNSQVRLIADNSLNPLFVARDVALALGYERPTDAIRQFCKGAVNYRPLQTNGGKQNTRVIKEPDVYRLIFGSKLESAIVFQNWVFEEVLPQIRQTGGYNESKNIAKLKQALLDMNERWELMYRMATVGMSQRQMALTLQVSESTINREYSKMRELDMLPENVVGQLCLEV